MPEITNLAPTTELEAVNAMLAAAGEDPLDDGTNLATTTQPDVKMALDILKDATREVQGMGPWKFNTEFGYEIAPTATYSWVDTEGKTTLLNIFKPPATKLLSFTVSPIPEQSGCRSVDVTIRKSRKYVEATLPVLVFYDREHARDGLEAAEHPFLYIDPVWMFDFEDLPETARRYITIRAARQFVSRRVGSETLTGLTERDELVALRSLKRDQGDEDDLNMLDTSDFARIHRFRQPVWRGHFDLRKNRNSI
jgi:hypothetical protein